MVEQREGLQAWRPANQSLGIGGGSLRKLAAMIWSEWLSRKSWIALAGILGTLPLLGLLLLLLPGFGFGVSKLMAASVAVLTGISSGLAALGVGLSLNWPELTEQRRGFFLAKPLSGNLLWAGKFLAGAGLIIIVILITALPGALAVTGAVSLTGFSVANEPSDPDGSPVVESVDEKEAMEFLALTPFFASIALPLFPLAFWAGIAMGTRTHWLGLDFLLLLLFSFLVRSGHSQLTALDFQNAAGIGASTLLITSWVALIAAGALSLARGGTSHQRMHQLLSLALWTPVTIAVAGQFAYASWYVRPRFQDLQNFEVVSAAPSGSWFEINGQVRGRDGKAQFLFDSATRRSLLVGWSQSVDGKVSYSADGKTAAWIEEGPYKKPFDQPVLQVTQLQGRRPRLFRLPLSADRRAYSQREVYLSPQGEFVVILSGYDLSDIYLGPQSAYRIRGGALEHTLDLSQDIEGRCGVPTFVDRSILRCYPLAETSGNEIVEIDLLKKTSKVVGSLPVYMLSWQNDYFSSWWFTVSLPAERIAKALWTAEPEGYEIALIDARSGEEIRRVPTGGTRSPFLLWLHTDDRLLAYDREGLQLKVYSSGGELLRSIDLHDEPKSGFVQVDADTLLFAQAQGLRGTSARVSSTHSERGLKLHAVDLSTGTVRALKHDLTPVLVGDWEGLNHLLEWRAWWRNSGFLSDARGTNSKIFYNPNGELEFYDFETGERRVLLQREARRD